ncbi:50S ribosomal protein L29 [Staphylococcus aureus]|nr:50S ribosomal protein L29 [Staphylococcus aureus]
MKAKEIRDLTTSEIEEQIKSSKEELFNLRFQLATGRIRRNCTYSYSKKTIARLKTVAREREIEQSKANQ